MLPRPRTSSVSILLLCALTSVLPPPLHGQSASSDQNGRPVFKANARTVVLDVVVAGKNGRPVVGLHKQDFLAAEDGNPQHRYILRGTYRRAVDPGRRADIASERLHQYSPHDSRAGRPPSCCSTI